MIKQTIVLMVLIGLLTSCAVSTNPKEGGFLGGIVGLSTGEYKARLERREDDLNRQQNLNQILKQHASTLEDEAQIRDAELALENQRLNKMGEDLSLLEAELGGLDAKSKEQEIEIASLLKRIREQRSKLESQQIALSNLDLEGGLDSDPEAYRMLELERGRLDREYSLLIEYTNSLSSVLN